MLVIVFLGLICPILGLVNTKVPSWWRPDPFQEDPVVFDDTPALFFQSRVDHFNDSNQATFNQRYWSNGQYYKANGPVFVVISGGLSGDPYWITNSSSEWCTLAATHGAWLFLVEHRYYGASRMVDVERTDKDFQWLTAIQSTEDFRFFIQTMRIQRPDFQTVKWAAMGASYAANLAVWLRVRYPQYVDFTIASSPPLQAKYDFTEMLEGVMQALQDQSAACASSVSQGFNQVAQLMKTAQGRSSLKVTFNLCTDLDPNNLNSQQYFWSTIINPYTSMVLYGLDNYGPYRTQLTIQKGICQFHESTSTSVMSRMQATFNNFNNAWGFGSFCTDIDYAGFVGYLANATDPYSDETRAWIWQECTELGYFITTDSPTAGPFFGGSLPLSYYTKICQTLFGQKYDANYGIQGTQIANGYFGGNILSNATYTIILNGAHDPWRQLSILQSARDDLLPVIIDGMGHRSDVYPVAPDDPAPLTTARSLVSSTIRQWLSLDKK